MEKNLIRNEQDVDDAVSVPVVPVRGTNYKHIIVLDITETVLVLNENMFALEVMVSVDNAKDDATASLYGYIIPKVSSNTASLQLVSCNGDIVWEFGKFKSLIDGEPTDIVDGVENYLKDIIESSVSSVLNDIENLSQNNTVLKSIITHLPTPLYNLDECTFYIPTSNCTNQITAMVMYTLKMSLNYMIAELMKRGIDGGASYAPLFKGLASLLEPYISYGQTLITNHIEPSIVVRRSVFNRFAGSESKLLCGVIMFDGVVLSSPMDFSMCKYSISITAFIDGGDETFMFITPNFNMNEIVYRARGFCWKPVHISLPKKLLELKNRQHKEYSEQIMLLIVDEINNYISSITLSTTDVPVLEKSMTGSVSNLLQDAWNESAVFDNGVRERKSVYCYKEKMPDGRIADSDNDSVLKDLLSDNITIVYKKIVDFNKPLEYLTGEEMSTIESQSRNENLLRAIIGDVFIDTESSSSILKSKFGYITDLSESCAIQSYNVNGNASSYSSLRMDIRRNDVDDIISQYPGVSLNKIPVTVVKIVENLNEKGFHKIDYVLGRFSLLDLAPSDFSNEYNRKSLGMFPWNEMFFIYINDTWRRSTKIFYDTYQGMKTTIDSKYRSRVDCNGYPDPTLREKLNISMGLNDITGIHISLEDGVPKNLFVSGDTFSNGECLHISTDCPHAVIRTLLSAAKAVVKNGKEFKEYLALSEEGDENENDR